MRLGQVAGQRLIPERGLKLQSVDHLEVSLRNAGQRLIPERGLKHPPPSGSPCGELKSRTEVNSRKRFETPASQRVPLWGTEKSRTEVNSRKGFETATHTLICLSTFFAAGQRLIPERGLKHKPGIRNTHQLSEPDRG